MFHNSNVDVRSLYFRVFEILLIFRLASTLVVAFLLGGR